MKQEKTNIDGLTLKKCIQIAMRSSIEYEKAEGKKVPEAFILKQGMRMFNLGTEKYKQAEIESGNQYFIK